MSLDNRAADRQPDAHAAALGGVERIKKLIYGLPVESRAGVTNRQAEIVDAFSPGLDEHLPRAVVASTVKVEAVRPMTR